MSPDGLLSIGELARHAGVTVKTVRFYSDSGLLPEARRSAGGHRRYGDAALARLRLIRSLRALDLPVPEVRRVLAREDAHGAEAAQDVLESAIAGQLQELGPRLTALRWREAALRLLRDCAPEERPERLRLIGALPTPPDTSALERFWRRVLPPRIPRRQLSVLLDAGIPRLPDDPSPAQVLTFARLYALATDTARTPDILVPPPPPYDRVCRTGALYDGLIEAYGIALPLLRSGRPPHPGEALDCFVAAHAGLRGTRDTPAFRRDLNAWLTRIADPTLERYFTLATELGEPGGGLGAGPEAGSGSGSDSGGGSGSEPRSESESGSGAGLREPTFGSIDVWLQTALDEQVATLG
ncbi:MerR family transcriptional regulator [Streptomyces sp. ODS28]|uniref:MerR family transcriptional regulator n=1 Tax=Streptomyces sp. ODS28 TaxID=3136688 RepID=UPI0031EB05B5